MKPKILYQYLNAYADGSGSIKSQKYGTSLRSNEGFKGMYCIKDIYECYMGIWTPKDLVCDPAGQRLKMCNCLLVRHHSPTAPTEDWRQLVTRPFSVLE